MDKHNKSLVIRRLALHQTWFLCLNHQNNIEYICHISISLSFVINISLWQHFGDRFSFSFCSFFELNNQMRFNICSWWGKYLFWCLRTQCAHSATPSYGKPKTTSKQRQRLEHHANLHTQTPPMVESNEVKRQLTNYIDKGWICPISSLFGAPVLFFWKTMGEIRMCIDYQELNKNTKKNRYPLPFMDEMFDLLSGSTAYSLLDLCSDYN